MKYVLLTDNSVQWFGYIACIAETGEAIEWYRLDSKISNDYISNLYKRGISFSNLHLVIPGEPCERFYGNEISEYEFMRVRKMIDLFPQVEEYNRLGKLE